MFHKIFSVLNAIALIGWTLVLYALILQDFKCSFLLISDQFGILDVVKTLEAICIIEVGRIACGQLKGNLTLGVVLHFIRVTNLVYVLPGASCCGTASNDGTKGASEVDFLAVIVLYSWSITEMFRYPYYLVSGDSSLAKMARFVRMTVPLVTFPIGAFSEGYATYLTLQLDEYKNTVKLRTVLMAAVVFINFVLGPSMAYPALLKKGVPMLLGKDSTKKTN